MSDRPTARAAKAALLAQLSGAPGIAGIGVSRQDADYVVRVDLAEAAAGDRVPGSVDGVAVVTRVIGSVRAMPAT